MSDVLDTGPATVRREPRYQQKTFELPGHAPYATPAWDLDGVAWFDAPAPPRFHDHWPQSVGQYPEFGELWRCPCGAIGGPAEPWVLFDKRRVAPGRLRRFWSRLASGETAEETKP